MTSIFSAAAYTPAAQQISRPGQSEGFTPPGQAKKAAAPSSEAPQGAGTPVAVWQVGEATGANPAPAPTPVAGTAQPATVFAAAVNGESKTAPEDIGRVAQEGYRDAVQTTAEPEPAKLMITA